MTRHAIRALGLAIVATFSFYGVARADDKAEIVAAATWATPIMGKTCDLAAVANGDLQGSYVYNITYHYADARPTDPDEVFPLIQLRCSTGPHSESYIFLSKNMGADDYSLLSFAEPTMAYEFTDGTETRLKATPRVTGYGTEAELVDADFDPKTKTISMTTGASYSGSFESAEWQFVDGEFVLTGYTFCPTTNPDPDGPADQMPAYRVQPETSKVIKLD